jgi:transposase
MARTLSEDLRGRVIAAVEGGASRRAAAERFGIGVATAIRWMRVFRATGTISAQPKGGDLRSHRIEAFRDAVSRAIEVQKDITLAELVALLRREHGASFAISTVHRHLVRHRITLKKSRARRRARLAGCGAQATGLVRRAA